MNEILVLYYSKSGSVKEMSSLIARGINSVDGAQAKIRTVPEISTEIEKKAPSIPDSGSLYATLEDVENCIGLALGSPTRFGNMAAPLKYFIETGTPLWLKGSLENKPACVFTSSSSLHGGNESTLLSMQIPLFHLGMVLLGLPYSLPELASTTSGGTPYGASHVSSRDDSEPITADEKKLCIAQGVRLAEISLKLKK
ncbi:NAD(P)H:quinone oxidoreductase [Methylophilaceae bacterium]|jgi:NAD(P)H dehydrogenase (quinone)|nr:NAD(P)H:quinone oxidoreductase [Methylophilaceae bacterium]|tara:strand:+ start:610 stop:1203 length:594 start_codon:yes stop_codon:yes gene_type:complete